MFTTKEYDEVILIVDGGHQSRERGFIESK